jgi:hypothetical protein
MVFAFLLAISGLTLSAVAIYYSVIGLTAVFAAAFWPIVVMGTTLEISKLVAASWLKAYWERIPISMKLYMSTAVVVLMVITSMGIFGFLSKAHLDQNIVSGDVQGKIAIYDEKIRTAKDNIDANRKALRQMDEAVDQVMGRSSDEKGADKAVQIRRSQQKERVRLQSEIQAEQKTIATLSEERAPIAAEVRKVEAEVGPIKYIAALIYGDNPDANILEKAVTWVIMIIVFVFDPLAVLMLLGAQMTWKWSREKELTESDNSIEDSHEMSSDIYELEKVKDTEDVKQNVWPFTSELWPFPKQQEVTQPKEELEVELVDQPVVVKEETSPRDLDLNEAAKEEKVDEVEFDIQEHARSYDVEQVELIKARMRQWKSENPESTIKEERAKKDLGIIDTLPWEETETDTAEKKTYMVKEGDQQVIKTRDDNYVQNAEQTEETLWKRIQDKKTK